MFSEFESGETEEGCFSRSTGAEDGVKGVEGEAVIIGEVADCNTVASFERGDPRFRWLT